MSNSCKRIKVTHAVASCGAGRSAEVSLGGVSSGLDPLVRFP
jgi:hypothetical protein